MPPPPPKLRPHPDGVGVPAVMGACPLCGAAPMASPAMVVGSGYVFCHSCAARTCEEEDVPGDARARGAGRY